MARRQDNIFTKVPDSNKGKYIDAITKARETAETPEDVAAVPGMIASAGKKYKQDSAKDIDAFKKLVREMSPQDVPSSWNTPTTSTKVMENGVLTRRHSSNKAPRGN